MNGISGTLQSKEGIKVNGLPQIAVDRSGGNRNGWVYIVTTEFNNSPAGSDPDIILHRSTDGGISWSAGIKVNQDQINNGKIQYFPAINVDDDGGINILFYDDRNTTSDSTDIFLAHSTNGGNSWGEYSIKSSRFKPKPILGGSSNYQGDHIGLISVGQKLFAFWMADYTGIYQAWLAIIDRNLLSVEFPGEKPANNFSLYQNFPNPFNPSTTIKYSIGLESLVQLKVFDILGNEISILVNEIKSAGEYSIEFNANKLSAGVYFYNLKAGSYSEMKKLVLLK
jgi:hypothetical protein